MRFLTQIAQIAQIFTPIVSIASAISIYFILTGVSLHYRKTQLPIHRFWIFYFCKRVLLLANKSASGVFWLNLHYSQYQNLKISI